MDNATEMLKMVQEEVDTAITICTGTSYYKPLAKIHLHKAEALANAILRLHYGTDVFNEANFIITEGWNEYYSAK